MRIELRLTVNDTQEFCSVCQTSDIEGAKEPCIKALFDAFESKYFPERYKGLK